MSVLNPFRLLNWKVIAETKVDKEMSKLEASEIIPIGLPDDRESHWLIGKKRRTIRHSLPTLYGACVLMYAKLGEYKKHIKAGPSYVTTIVSEMSQYFNMIRQHCRRESFYVCYTDELLFCLTYFQKNTCPPNIPSTSHTDSFCIACSAPGGIGDIAKPGMRKRWQKVCKTMFVDPADPSTKRALHRHDNFF